MNSEKLTDAEIRTLGWQALIDALGPSGALRFAIQTERGHGDYAETRHQMLGDLSVDELLKRMGEAKRKEGGSRRGKKASAKKGTRRAP